MKSNRKYYITIFSSIFLMFFWIILTVILTGGRETYEFTKRDFIIFGIFILTEIATIGVMTIALVKLIKNTPELTTQSAPVPKTKYERVVQRRGIWLLVAAYIITLIFMILGIIYAPRFAPSATVVFKVILTASFALLPILIACNLFLKKRHVKKIEKMRVDEAQQFVIENRSSAKEIAAEKLAFLKCWRTFTNIYAILLFVVSILAAFSAGAIYSDAGLSTVFYLLSALICICALSRIQFPLPSAFYEENKSYVSKEDYPEIYALARHAADTLHCQGEIKLAIVGDCNAGIAKTKNTYSIQLGAILLNLLSKDELYTVLLHEFAHVAANNAANEKEMSYYSWICNGGNPNYYSGFASAMFLYSDIIYTFHHSLYQYASALANETIADQIMGTLGDAKHAASALIKIKYYDLYSWEKGTRDEICFYATEELNKTFLETEVHELKAAIPNRKEFWNTLIEDEILSRSASHPTLKMRLESIGISTLELTYSPNPVSYNQECLKAIQQFEELLCTENAEQYKENRNSYYLESLKLITEWETAGKPLIPEEYSDIDQALRKLGRNEEASALCDRAIEELDDAASCYAYFMKGCFLLHSYDASGIDLIYHAIENNNNYIEEGLDVIGEFCCLVGREDDLATYRQRAVVIAQRKKDVYDESLILRKNDTLTSESLPEELHNGILEYISSIEDNQIQKVYLVRKTITDDFFTSAFIVQFEKDTSAETQNRVMHKLFSYLDTGSNWQFSLFEYETVKYIKFENIENSCFYSK